MNYILCSIVNKDSEESYTSSSKIVLTEHFQDSKLITKDILEIKSGYLEYDLGILQHLLNSKKFETTKLFFDKSFVSTVLENSRFI